MTVRLVLTMIVKNESAVIDRCLGAALPHCDGYVIVDTGSTDDTIEKIRKAAADVPGVVHTDVWEDFGTNRTRSAERAREWVKSQGWDAETTYLLLLDADMIFRVSERFNKSELNVPHYRIPQQDGVLRYLNTRIVRLSHAWRSVGVTHEYWASTPDCVAAHVDFAWIDDIGDGGAKGNKTARDIALLQKGLEAEPDNGRYMFYLAQSWFDARQWDAAIEWYEKRIATGGWDEEVWYAHYKLGCAYLERAKHTKANGGSSLDAETGAGILAEAYQRRPNRAEPLVHLARSYREQGKNHLAYMAARQALSIPYPADTLFVDEPMHRRGALEEIAITGYYLDQHEEGRAACERLLASKRDAGPFHDHIARCLSFYVKPISPLAVRRGDFVIPDVIRAAPGPFFGGPDPNTTVYNPSNPTIVQVGDEYLTNVRLVNYYHERGRVFAPKDEDGVVRTRNIIQYWDPESGQATAMRESVSSLPFEWDHKTRVRGLEDQRWCYHNGQIWVTFTCFNIPESRGMPFVALGRVKESRDGLENIRALRYAGAGPYEKNWLPWSRLDGRSELTVIYGYDPFRVMRVDTETGECTVISETVPSFATHRWRGSAGPIPTPHDGKYLGLVHETAWFEGEVQSDQRTVYMHRFFECTDTEITRRSDLFTFDHSGVEYAAGLACLPNGNYVVTHSIEEASAHWKEFTWETIDGMLHA